MVKTVSRKGISISSTVRNKYFYSKKTVFAATLLAFATHIACAVDDPTIATVNGQVLTQSTLKFYATERRQVDSKNTLITEHLVDDIVNMQLLNEEALKQKLNKTPEFLARMNFITLKMMSQAAMIDFLDNNPIPEERLRNEYDKRIGDIKVVELKASHILLKSEAEAKKVIGKLNDGADFTAMAKEYSTGPTASKGGDLGWFAPRRMVQEFSQAILAMKDGEYTKLAVRTQFGWHVILRYGQRDGTPPSFEEVKPNIAAALEQEHILQYINDLRKKASIDINS